MRNPANDTRLRMRLVGDVEDEFIVDQRQRDAEMLRLKENVEPTLQKIRQSKKQRQAQ